MFHMTFWGILNSFLILFSEKTYKFNLDVCYQFYFDKDEKPANYTPSETTAQPTTKSANRNAGKYIKVSTKVLYIYAVRKLSSNVNCIKIGVCWGTFQ